MNNKEISRYDVIKRLIRNEINGTKAADLIKLSIRHTKRLKAAVKKKGARGLIHGNRGKTSNRKMPDEEKKEIISLLKEKYFDFKPTFATEKLSECHNINRDPKTIRQIMIDNDLWRPKLKSKQSSFHRSWRQRRSNYGEMEQFDGSYHNWFESRALKCCLLLSVDDATGNITNGYFAEDEGVFPVFNFWLNYLEKEGKPMSIYMDKFSTYKMSQKAAIDNHDLKTQFQRALEQLQIEPIFANSPQAKGRIEKIFHTLQDRLIKELRLHNISTIEAANHYLKRYFIPAFNRKFGVKPSGKTNLHRQLSAKELFQLSSIFSKQTRRSVQNDFTVSFNNQWFQLTKYQPVTVCKRDEIIIEEHLDGSIKMRLRGKYLNYIPIAKRTKPLRDSVPWVLAASPMPQSNS
ncbi:MAG: ISNCY family transposase [Candidatus Parcubacteria bacterium]|nr:ISNCY family transposase [Candidatus Parcubacteria bacterium]